MRKRKTYIGLAIIFVLAFGAFNLIYPQLLNLPYFPKVPFKLGLDLQGGAHLVYEADFSKSKITDEKETIAGLRDIIERRVNILGVAEPVVQAQKDRLIVEIAGVIDPAQAIQAIGKTPFLEFKEELPAAQSEEIIKAALKEDAGDIPTEAACQDLNFVNQFILIYGQDPCFQSTSLNGRYLKRAQLDFDQTTFEPQVVLEFNEEGKKLFEELTEKNVRKSLAISVDNILISAPVVQEKISGGQAQITGSFSREGAKSLANNLNAGALPIPINLISQQTVGPILGKASLEKSLQAGIWGFAAILLFLMIFYRLPGFFAALSLLIYVLFMLSLVKLIPVTLTLAGIAGFLLSVGMAVDANILIFSRLKEELKQGKDFATALKDGAKRAWPAIRDGNFTTILVGLILFGLGTSFVKGFAFTLVIGNLVSMFSAIFITNNLLRGFVAGKLEKLTWLWK